MNTPKGTTIHNYGFSCYIIYKSNFGLELMLGNVLSFAEVDTENEFLLQSVKCDSPQNMFVFSVSYEVFKFVNVNFFGHIESKRKTHSLFELDPINLFDVSITYRPNYSNHNLRNLNKFYLSLNLNNIFNNKVLYPLVSDNYQILSGFPVNKGFTAGLNLGYKF